LTKIDIKSAEIINDELIICLLPEPIIELPPNTPPENPPAPIKPLIPIEVSDDTIIDDEPDIPNLEIDDFQYALPDAPEDIIEEDIFDVHGIEVLPAMHGGLIKLYSEIKYPEMARKAGIEGTVIVQFIVNKEGLVESPEIYRGIGGGCDEEVLRVIQKMRFSPGVQNGNLVKVRMAQAFRFQLQN
jgi:protein TonB